MSARNFLNGRERAAGERGFGGFYFFDKTRAAEATGRFEIGWQGNMRQFGAPAAAFGLAGHGGAAFGAVFLHGKSMPRRIGKVKQWKAVSDRRAAKAASLRAPRQENGGRACVAGWH